MGHSLCWPYINGWSIDLPGARAFKKHCPSLELSNVHSASVSGGIWNTSTNHFGIWLGSWALGQAATEPIWVHEFRGVVIPKRHCLLWCSQIYGFTIFCPSSAIVSEPWDSQEGVGHIDIHFVAEYSTNILSLYID